MKKIIVIAFFLLSSCFNDPNYIRHKTVSLAKDSGFVEKIYHNYNFKIFTLQKIKNPKLPIRVYLEGDGKAYINSRLPSINPTPRSYFFVNLMFEDDYPNIIYIARPCQYFKDDSKCDIQYWTINRFSQEIINSVNEVLKNFKDKELELVGYSGGGQIALQLASKDNNKNIINIRTIAGNLDPDEFTNIHQVSKLEFAKLDFNRLSKIPQVHFVGTYDDIVPSSVSSRYIDKLESSNCTKIIEVNMATHYQGWSNWPSLIEQNLPSCRFKQ